jgi:hypothetical protein
MEIITKRAIVFKVMKRIYHLSPVWIIQRMKITSLSRRKKFLYRDEVPNHNEVGRRECSNQSDKLVLNHY